LVVSETLPEVEVFHKSKNRGKRMFPSGINADEWHYILVRETSACEYFMVKPLSVGC